MPDPNPFEFEIAVVKTKRHISPNTDQISTELIKTGGRTMFWVPQTFLIIFGKTWNYLRNGRGLSFYLLRTYKKGDKTHCSYYRTLSVLSITYHILSAILLSRLTPHAEDITGYNQVGFRINWSTTYHIFQIRQILEKNGNIMKQLTSYLKTLKHLWFSCEAGLV